MEKMIVVLVPAKGKPQKIVIPDDDTLHGMQKLVGGGFIEIVRPKLLPRDWVMVVDDEGKLKDYPVNLLGTILYDSPWDTINGDLFLCREINSLCGVTPIIVILVHLRFKRLMTVIPCLHYCINLHGAYIVAIHDFHSRHALI